MPRNLPAAMVTAIEGNAPQPCFLLDLQLASGTVHAWTGVGSIVWNGNTYTGLGSFAGVGAIQEGVQVRADGTSVTLSGIDTTLLNDSLSDIQVNAPATLWLGAFSNGAILAAAVAFKGVVGAPAIAVGPKTITIQVALETKMSNLKRATNRRYTTADQMYYHPDDSGFNWVETLNDVALRWG